MQGHLIHIGYPKTGSTFLQEWFRQNPQLFYAPGGLGGFYNVYQISQKASQKTDENFTYFVTSNESLSRPTLSIGNIPIEYGLRTTSLIQADSLSQKKVCEILKCLYPNAKILFITRGFKAIIMSSYSHFVRVGGVLNFQAFIDKSLFEMQNQTVKDHNSGEEVNFTYIADLYEEAFGKENVIILPFELLRDDQNKFLTLIEARLGLAHFETQIGRINESLSPEELYWYPRISSIVSRISQRFGQKGYAIIYRWYVIKTLKNKFRRVVKILSWLHPGHAVTDADLPFEILDYFRENNADRFAAKFRDEPMYAPYLSEYLLIHKDSNSM